MRDMERMMGAGKGGQYQGHERHGENDGGRIKEGQRVEGKGIHV